MSIKVKNIHVAKRICVTPAHVIFEDTGKTRAVDRVDDDGAKFVENVPVRKKKFVDAVYRDETETQQRFSVEDGGETHNFATEAQAKDFLKWKGRGA